MKVIYRDDSIDRAHYLKTYNYVRPMTSHKVYEVLSTKRKGHYCPDLFYQVRNDKGFKAWYSIFLFDKVVE